MSKQLQVGIAIAAGLAVVGFFFLYQQFNVGSMLTPSSSADNSSLVVQDEAAGSGSEAQVGDTVTVNYTGKFENGTVFDTSVGKQPFSFQLGAGNVIPGWDQGLVGMKVGGKRMLIVPPSLAYGSQDYGPIPANSTLIFEVELVSVKK